MTVKTKSLAFVLQVQLERHYLQCTFLQVNVNNPMKNCVSGVFFGHSPNGWISTELFYGWLANHFSKRVSIHPIVLLVDGHSSHIDLHISKFCKENDILSFCLPPHSSHVT